MLMCNASLSAGVPGETLPLSTMLCYPDGQLYVVPVGLPASWTALAAPADPQANMPSDRAHVQSVWRIISSAYTIYVSAISGCSLSGFGNESSMSRSWSNSAWQFRSRWPGLDAYPDAKISHDDPCGAEGLCAQDTWDARNDSAIAGSMNGFRPFSCLIRSFTEYW